MAAPESLFGEATSAASVGVMTGGASLTLPSLTCSSGFAMPVVVAGIASGMVMTHDFLLSTPPFL